MERVRDAREDRRGQVPLERLRPRAVAVEQPVEHLADRREIALAAAHHVGGVGGEVERGRGRASSTTGMLTASP